MRILKLMGITSIILLALIACSSQNEEQINKIVIEKRELVDDSFIIYKEITDQNQLKEINEFLDNIKWEQVEIDITLPDYKVTVQNKDVYKIWKNKHVDIIEVIFNDTNYSSLSKPDSEKMFHLLMGTSLVDEE